MPTRVGAYLLILTFAFVGTGALRYLHDLQHLRDDRATAQAAPNTQGRKAPTPIHTEWNCELHALLSAPLLAAGVVPLLIFLGLLVAFLTELAPVPVSLRPFFRLDCRGPPSC